MKNPAGSGNSRRVLHVIDSLDLGGAQTVLLNLVRAWPRADFPIEVATMHGEGVFAGAFRSAGIPVHSLSPHKYWPAYLWRLFFLLRRRDFAVLHCHLFGANWLAKPVGALCRLPLVVSHDHCNDQLRHTKRAALLLDRLTNHFSHLVIGVSASTCNFLKDHEGISPARVHLVHNGVDTTEFSPPSPEEKTRARARRGWSGAEFLVGGVGRFVEQKNFSRWLRVLAKIRQTHPGVRGVLAGSGPLEAELRRQAAGSGLADAICFAGLVDDRVDLYHSLDALLVTSDFEGLPMNVLEAMACGVPVVASRVDGLAEIIDEGTDALLAAPAAEDEFVKALAGLVAAPELAARLADRARRKVESSFSAGAMAAQIAGLYGKHFESYPSPAR